MAFGPTRYGAVKKDRLPGGTVLPNEGGFDPANAGAVGQGVLPSGTILPQEKKKEIPSSLMPTPKPSFAGLFGKALVDTTGSIGSFLIENERKFGQSLAGAI